MPTLKNRETSFERDARERKENVEAAKRRAAETPTSSVAETPVTKKETIPAAMDSVSKASKYVDSLEK